MPPRARGGHEAFKIGFVGGKCADAFTAFLHVVVPILDEQVVARLHDTYDFVESVRPERTAQRFSGLGVIRDRDAVVKKPRQHLPPAVPRFFGLIAYGGVAEQIDGSHIIDALDLKRSDTRVGAVELEREFFVPVNKFGGSLTFFQANLAPGADFGRADVHVERPGNESALGRLGRLDNKAPKFGLDGGVARPGGVSECDGHAIVSFWDLGGKQKWQISADRRTAGFCLTGFHSVYWLKSVAAVRRIKVARLHRRAAGRSPACAEFKP